MFLYGLWDFYLFSNVLSRRALSRQRRRVWRVHNGRNKTDIGAKRLSQPASKPAGPNPANPASPAIQGASQSAGKSVAQGSQVKQSEKRICLKR